MIEQLKRFSLIGASAASCLWIITLAASALSVDLTSKQMVMVYAIVLMAKGFRSDDMKHQLLDTIDSVVIALCATFAMLVF